MGCSYKIQNLEKLECSNIQPPIIDYTFKNGKCYSNGQLLGFINKIEGNKITVEHKNGSLANGTIRIFYAI